MIVRRRMAGLDPISSIADAVGSVANTVGGIFNIASGNAERQINGQVSIANMSMQSQFDINRTNAQIAAAQIAAAEKQAETQKQMLLYGGAGLGALVFLGLILKR